VALVVINAIIVEDILRQDKFEDPDVIASEIGCMLEVDHCPIKSRGDKCDGTAKVHACSDGNCKRNKKMHTCNDMQKLMLGTGLYQAMKTCIPHRGVSMKLKQQPERAKRNRRNMREKGNPRNNKKPEHKEAVRASKRRAKIRELQWVESTQSHAEELVQPQKVTELQTFVDDHSNGQLQSLFNAKLSDVVAVDSAVRTRGGGDKGKNLYSVVAYSGHSARSTTRQRRSARTSTAASSSRARSSST
jgi:hypothetical protein